MKNLLKGVWTRVWKFLNNGYVRTIVIWSIMSTTVLISVFTKIRDSISQQDLQNLFSILQFVLPVLVAPWLCKTALTWWRAWCLVRLPGDSISHAFDPFLRLTGWWNRRFGPINIEKVVSLFSMASKFNNTPLFSLNPAQLDCSRYPYENPLFVLKLPARTHLAVGDFVVLRLMRHILASGGRLLVIIIDATRDTEEVKQDMMEKVVCTRHFLQRMLGSAPKIVTMSEIYMAHAQSATNFLLTHFVVFFVNSFPGIQHKEGTSTDLVSFFTKGLILYALSQMVKSDPVIMVQWVKRQDSWVDIYSALPTSGNKLRITEFLQISSFPNESGTLLGTKNPDFAIVPEGKWLLHLLDSSSNSNKTYVLALGQALLGKGWNKNSSTQEKVQERLREKLKKVQKSLAFGLRR